MSKSAKPGPTKDVAVFPDGTTFRCLGEHFIAAIIPLPEMSEILVMPDGSRAACPLGRDANKPIVWGKVLATGPKVHTLKPGDVVLIHPMNTNTRKIAGISYYIPREKAAYCVVDAE